MTELGVTQIANLRRVKRRRKRCERPGFPVAHATLETKASRGGGPPFRRFGRKPLYEWGPTLEWARLAPVRASLEHVRSFGRVN